MGVLVNVVFGQRLLRLKKKKKKGENSTNPEPAASWALEQLHGKHCGGPRGGQQAARASGISRQSHRPCMSAACRVRCSGKGGRSVGTFTQADLPQQGHPLAPLPFPWRGPALPSCSLGSLPALLPGQQMLKKGMVGFSQGVPKEGNSLSRKSRNEKKACNSTPWNFPENSLVTVSFHTLSPHLPTDSLKLPHLHKSPLTTPPVFQCDFLTSPSSARCPTSPGTSCPVASDGPNIFI